MFGWKYIILAIFFLEGADAHGYLSSPRSRNYIAWQEGVWSGTTATDYPKEDCPHCANIGGTLARCGMIGSRNYDENLNFFGQPIPANPERVYSPGDYIEVDVILTAHHKGHFEFSACPIEYGEIPSGDCFASNPLEFMSDPLYGAPPDANYPNRAYIPPRDYIGIVTDNSGVSGSLHRFILKLPDNIVGDLVLLQWHYFTANTCKFAGYESYNFPADWGDMTSAVGVCDSISLDGKGAPEQFWNCAEISIKDGASSPNPGPIAEPTNPPSDLNPTTSYPTLNPTYTPSSSPITWAPIRDPTPTPSAFPGPDITDSPVLSPTTLSPTLYPTDAPSSSPVTWAPIGNPTLAPASFSETMGPFTAAPYSSPALNPSSPILPIVSSTDPTLAPSSFSETMEPIADVTSAPNSPPALHPSSPISPNAPSPLPSLAPVTEETGTPALRQPWENWVISLEPRCGTSEADARGNCRKVCNGDSDCDYGHYCWIVHENYCGSKPQPDECQFTPISGDFRCGISELVARETCGEPCTKDSECNEDIGEYCFALNLNMCSCNNMFNRMLRGKASQS